MLDTSSATSQLEAARAFADRVGLRTQLETRLARLERYAAPRRTRCTLYPDRDTHCFTFVMELESRDGEWCPWFAGELAYRGPADAGPLPRPCDDDAMGWTIHC